MSKILNTDNRGPACPSCGAILAAPPHVPSRPQRGRYYFEYGTTDGAVWSPDDLNENGGRDGFDRRSDALAAYARMMREGAPPCPTVLWDCGRPEPAIVWRSWEG